MSIFGCSRADQQMFDLQGCYLSLSSPHLGIQSSWLQPMHAWRNLCWLTRAVTLQLCQLAIQDSSERPYLLEISHAESEAWLPWDIWDISNKYWVLRHSIQMNRILCAELHHTRENVLKWGGSVAKSLVVLYSQNVLKSRSWVTGTDFIQNHMQLIVHIGVWVLIYALPAPCFNLHYRLDPGSTWHAVMLNKIRIWFPCLV